VAAKTKPVDAKPMSLPKPVVSAKADSTADEKDWETF
jgi:hypothetical protein